MNRFLISLAAGAAVLAALFAFSLQAEPAEGARNLQAEPIESAQGSETAPSESIWTDAQLRRMRSLVLDDSVQVPADPSNAFATNAAAAALGERLFHDPGLSRTGTVSCATCHQPERSFTDGQVFSKGIGQTARHTPTVLGVAFGDWFYWDGRRDSLWAQALVPIEAHDEMGSSRVDVVKMIARDTEYKTAYEETFGPLPKESWLTRIPDHAGPFGDARDKNAWARLGTLVQRDVNTAFANVGKAIAAFQSTLRPDQSRFDRYVGALVDETPPGPDALLTAGEMRGLALFLDEERTRCMNCHNGPMFSNYDFQNIGTGKFSGGRLDLGRAFAIPSVLVDEFNCLGPYSDAPDDGCGELRFVSRGDHSPIPMNGAFKVPTLRHVAQTAPYFHDGRFATLTEVLEHYRSPPTSDHPHELVPLDLSDTELGDLAAFLGTLH